MASVIQAWSAVVAQTQQLLTLAEQGEWEQVEPLLAQRAAQIEQLSQRDVAPAQADAVRACIEQIRQADQSLAVLAQTQRQQALDGLRQEGNANKMKAAYNRTKRGF